MNKVLKDLLLLFLSVIIALFVTEGLARLFFDPIDFLKPKTLSDEVLRYRIEPNSGAHDSWGYRNKKVPESAKIVAIGDSHTYGISATASNSWPSALEKITGDQTYNLGLGGYGPAEYLYLMKENALKLSPEIIIIGFYLGNDLKDSFTAVYSVPVWKDLRNPVFSYSENENKNIEEDSLTEWLSGHSVLYRIVSSSFIGDNLRQQRRLSKGEDIPMLDLPEYEISTGFTPDRRLKGLDLSNPEVREGLRLTLDFFNKMNRIANENKIDFLVVIIPTKETVYSDLISESGELANSYELTKLIQNEKVVNKVVQTYFTDHSIPFVDVLEPMKEVAKTEQIYPNNFGGHSNNNGYRIIAESISKFFKSKASQ